MSLIKIDSEKMALYKVFLSVFDFGNSHDSNLKRFAYTYKLTLEEANDIVQMGRLRT